MGPIGTAALGIGTGLAEGAAEQIFGEMNQKRELRGHLKILFVLSLLMSKNSLSRILKPVMRTVLVLRWVNYCAGCRSARLNERSFFHET